MTLLGLGMDFDKICMCSMFKYAVTRPDSSLFKCCKELFLAKLLQVPPWTVQPSRRLT